MGEHKRQGKTFFVTKDKDFQFAIHRAPSGHFSRIAYYKGCASKSERITQADAALIMGISVAKLLDKFKLD